MHFLRRCANTPRFQLVKFRQSLHFTHYPYQQLKKTMKEKLFETAIPALLRKTGPTLSNSLGNLLAIRLIRSVLFWLGLAVFAFIATASHVAAESEYGFISLGDLSGGSFESSANSVSANGLVIVGYGTSSNGKQAFRWTSGSGMVSLGDLAGGNFESSANGVSANGSVIVGYGTSGNGREAFRWTSGSGLVNLGDLVGGSFESSANGVSADGSVIVGYGTSSNGREAFGWTPSGKMVGLGDFPGGSFNSVANSASADGSIVVGYGASSSGREALRGTLSGITRLGDLAGGSFNSVANSASADGSVVVGYGTSSNGREAFRWTPSSRMVGLGDLPGGSFSSVANAVSADGSVVVGSGSSSNGREAFIWTQANGMENLKDKLAAREVNMTGWILSEATGVSSDGNTIVGYGTNPNGDREAWAVFASPKIITHPQNQAVKEGEAVRFSVAAVGSAPLSYQWQKDGINIPGATKASYTIVNTQSGDAGAYRVIISNAAGTTVSNAATLRVITMIFTPLGDLPGGGFESYAYDISTDGSVVVGYSKSSNGQEAFRWTQADGMGGLGDLPGGSFLSIARGVSTYGSLIVGQGNSINGREAFRRPYPGSMAGLGDLPGGDFDSQAYGVSMHGSIIVGQGNTINGAEALRWTSDDRMFRLGDLDGGSVRSAARDVSSDGSVIVGWSSSSSGIEAFRWTPYGGMVGIGDLPGGLFSSEASSVSADGSVIVGSSRSSNGSEAFRWTKDDSRMVGLGDFPGGIFSSYAKGVSEYGSVVVGYGTSSNGAEAFIWTQDNGMKSIKDKLVASGVNMSGWHLIEATGVSGDGTKIVGYGTNPSGQVEAWLVSIIPSPFPAVFAHPQSQTVSVGASVTFQVVTTGAEPLSYQWQRKAVGDGEDFFSIPGAISTSYTVVNAQVEDAGGYRVIVSNALGSTTSNAATLRVRALAIMTFTPLGKLSGGDSYSRPTGISWDGLAVIGYSSSNNGIEAFRRTQAAGMVGLGDLPGGIFSSHAYGTSANGYVVVGSSKSNNGTEAFRLMQLGSMVGLGDLPGGAFYSEASGTSANGSIVVGVSSSSNGTEAFRWTQQDNRMVGLGDLPGGIFSSAASGTSANGSVVVGYGTSSNGTEAFRWTQQDNRMVGLGDLPGGIFSSHANDLSADGSVVIGSGTSSSGTEAFLWTQDENKMVGLGDLPGGIFSSHANDLSADGSVVVGSGNTNNSQDIFKNYEAFIWTQAGGMESIQDKLVARGVDITGWHLREATGVSGDGTRIVGYGSNPSGGVEGWLVTILPLPTPPAIAIHPQSQTVSAGASLALGVVATGTEPFSYQWQKKAVGDNKVFANILGATSPDYTIVNAQAINAGEYRVIVSNAAGNITSNAATLRVDVPLKMTFTPLGDLLGGNFDSRAYGISLDGLVIVGASISSNGWEAFRWVQANGMVGLGDLPGDIFYSAAFGVSADGSVVVGYSKSSNGWEAFTWPSNNGMVGLGDLDGGNFDSRAYGVSADGSVAVGYSASSNGGEAFRWTRDARRMAGLGDLDGGGFDSSAYGVSADGSVIVGSGKLPDHIEAFRLISNNDNDDMTRLGVLEGFHNSLAKSVSADGSAIVGSSYSDNESEAFRWTQTGHIVGLGDLPGGIFSSHAYGASANGSVVVGSGTSNNGREAFFWTQVGGIASIQDKLVTSGIDMTGWHLTDATGVSGDGTKIVGHGTNPSGHTEAWLVSLTRVIQFPVPVPVPFIPLHPKSQVINAGASATFGVLAVGGAESLSYQWQRKAPGEEDFSNIFGATNATYTISNVQSTDAGEYRVIVMNPSGSTTSNAATLALDTHPFYTAWKKEQFREQSEHEEISGPEADPDGDGRANLHEYAFATNPLSTTHGKEPISIALEPMGGENHIILKFLHRKTDDTLEYEVQQSSDLDTWAKVTPLIQESENVDSDFDLRTLHVQQSLEKTFLRLIVRQN